MLKDISVKESYDSMFEVSLLDFYLLLIRYYSTFSVVLLMANLYVFAKRAITVQKLRLLLVGMVFICH